MHGRHCRAFTLIELLVVIGIIALLLAMLLPVTTRVRQQALSVKCKAQMRDVGLQLRMYSEEFKGVLFPLGPEYNNPKTGQREWHTLGYEPSMPDLGRSIRWPVALFKINDEWVNNTWDKSKTPQELEVNNPDIIKCPADEMPREDHTYILNKYLARKIDMAIKLGGRVRRMDGGVMPDSEVVLLGEKRTSEPDYYMEADPDSEFDRVVEPYRHGLRLGSNYLYLDLHVDTVAPKAIKDHMDSWDAIGAPIGPDPKG
jgi:prepilin-type N-terminal cleavage/methylation domain-containing protein/prepilin-type processing-associated H-X9-DG protein